MRHDRWRLTCCDISTFYCERGGGIRTYHNAKLEWFGRQADHEYVLIVPGRRFRMSRPSPRTSIVEVASVPTGRGRGGYRVMVDYGRVRDVLSAIRPDVIEASDPWVGGPFALIARRQGHVSGLVTSFYHTDSIAAYARPWLAALPMPDRWCAHLLCAARRTFWKVQSLYDATLVASASMEQRAQAEGIACVMHTPFGVDARFLERPPRRSTRGLPARLLYVGRLQDEKSFDLVLAGLPALLDDPDVQLTVAGEGPLARELAAFDHQRVSVLGYIADRDALCDLYRRHDILLATSATETFGIAALEAMASGMTVVGADEGGIGDLVAQAESPFAFRARSLGSFVSAVRAAIHADRTDAGARARAVAEAYGTWDDAIARQTAAYVALHTERTAMSTVLRTPHGARPVPLQSR